MKKAKALSIYLSILLLMVILSPNQLDAASRIQLEWGLGSHTATGAPFDVFPLLKLGYHRELSRSLSLGISLSFTRWSDYLGMFCGAFNFNCFRPEIELGYLFPAFLDNMVNTFAGVGLGYHFYHVTNDLGCAYDGELKGHLFLSPFLGLHFGLGKKAIGMVRPVYITARLAWEITGDFSGLRGSLGLGIRLN